MNKFSFVKIFFASAIFLAVSCTSQNNPVPAAPYYENFYQPNSRLYQDPYQQPPRQYYPYYDSDYYYVPPRNNYYYSNPYEGASGKTASTPADYKY